MRNLDEYFDFKMGDFVEHRLSRAIQGNGAVIGTVVTRWLEECPGGIQQHYTLSVAVKDDNCIRLASVRFNEVDLELARITKPETPKP